ncbi:MAG: Gfo/Idh/MocA family oxidoreductase [Bacteroidota bacterium]
MTSNPTTRRDALKKLAWGGGSLALAPWPSSLRPPPKEKLGVALVGLGYYSTELLAPALQLTEHCYLAGIVTGSYRKIPMWQERYRVPDRNVYSYESFDEIANNDEIDVVYVVLPNSLHAEFSIRAALAGKHVWCEKPMALNVQQCLAMIQAAESSGVSLSIGYRMQHEPVTRMLMGLVLQPAYGEVRHIAAGAGYRGEFEGNPRHWRTKKRMGGGAMYDMGVYPLQATRYTTGLEPVAVRGEHRILRPEIFSEVDETTLFDLQFANGTIAQCASSFAMSMDYLRVTYEKGWAKLDPFSKYEKVGGTCSDGTSLRPWAGNQQVRQMDAEARAILAGRPPLVSGQEGLKDIQILEAIHQSASLGDWAEL